jgi:NADH-quinone oxidoreductase subunit G
MTRCIHCTRCVRFGQEIAGIMELGMAGRGEHAEIMAPSSAARWIPSCPAT